MTKYAPIYMSVYDGSYSLTDLTLDNDTFTEGAVAGTVIGAISGAQPEDSTLSIVGGTDEAALDGSDLVVGDTVAAAGTFDVTVRETSKYGENSPHDTTFTITVSAP